MIVELTHGGVNGLRKKKDSRLWKKKMRVCVGPLINAYFTYNSHTF